jgi:hypothetical protein
VSSKAGLQNYFPPTSTGDNSVVYILPGESSGQVSVYMDDIFQRLFLDGNITYLSNQQGHMGIVANFGNCLRQNCFAPGVLAP